MSSFERNNRSELVRAPRGFGPGWEATPVQSERFVTEPFMLRRVTSDLSGHREERFSNLLDELQRRGVVLLELDKEVQFIPAGTAILHDQGMRAIFAIAGRNVAEWVRDILEGDAEIAKFMPLLDDILATTPPTPYDD